MKTYILSVCHKQLVVNEEDLKFYNHLSKQLEMEFPEYWLVIQEFLGLCSNNVSEIPNLQEIVQATEDNFVMTILRFEEEKLYNPIFLRIYENGEIYEAEINYTSDAIKAYYQIKNPSISIFKFQDLVRELGDRRRGMYQMMEIQPDVKLTVCLER